MPPRTIARPEKCNAATLINVDSGRPRGVRAGNRRAIRLRYTDFQFLPRALLFFWSAFFDAAPHVAHNSRQAALFECRIRMRHGSESRPMDESHCLAVDMA